MIRLKMKLLTKWNDVVGSVENSPGKWDWRIY